ncbi:MAG: PPC domain-containing protein [Deltaproteobacteria bacterium]|jgi:hypothetical protein|nr:PPC domain-containing protein [Deltaproteobacteria bacterium]
MKAGTYLFIVVALAASLALMACSSGGDGDGDGGPGDGGADGGDTSPEPDGTSCELGLPLPVGNPSGVDGAIDPPGEVDHYLVDLEEGVFYMFYTVANPNDDLEMIDTVISLYTPDGNTLLATGDDAVPRVSTDTELFYRAAETGQVCLKLEEFTTWYGEAAEGGPTFTYKVIATDLEDEQPENNEDAEPNDSAGAAQELTFQTGTGGNYAYLYGTFATADDVDVYAFTQGASEVNTYLYFMPDGPGGFGDGAEQGHGSTADLGLVNVSDMEGNLLASLDVSLGSDSLGLPLDPGSEVAIWVQRPAGSSTGGNDFYFLKQTNLQTDNDREGEDADGTNDTAATAESLSFSEGSAYVLGFIDPVSDVDYFSFTASAGDTFNIACGSIRSGSGLEDVTFAVHAEDDSVVRSETETATADVLWIDDYPDASDDALTISEAGTYYLVVSAGGQSPDVSSNFYRCGVHEVE